MRLSLSLVDEERESFGGFSKPSKMPWLSYNLPARACKVGSRLSKTKGSVCEGCYAFRGNYAWKTVQAALERRLAHLKSDPFGWANKIVTAIKKRLPKPPKGGLFFRWHDSGDLQSSTHLQAICFIANQLPEVTFWLPTREYQMVEDFFKEGGIRPDNLTIRLSAHMIDGAMPHTLAEKYGLSVSGVTRVDERVTCPAPQQDNKCGECRRCWNNSVKEVYYRKH